MSLYENVRGSPLVAIDPSGLNWVAPAYFPNNSTSVRVIGHEYGGDDGDSRVYKGPAYDFTFNPNDPFDKELAEQIMGKAAFKQFMLNVGKECAENAVQDGALTVVGAAVGLGLACKCAGGMGNIGSHDLNDAGLYLRNAETWLGKGYKEIAPGVFRSADGTRQFRLVTTSDLRASPPHVHFEAFDPVTGVREENLHLPIKP